MTVKDYLDLLKSDAPAPGGGSVSALSAAQGVGLVAMVADLTIGREKYAEYEEVCKAAKEEALKLYSELVAGIDKDTEAFNKVSAAYKLPKNTDEEKAARSAAEPITKIEKWIYHLRNAGKLRQCKGIILGQFTEMENADENYDYICCIKDALEGLDIPVMYDIQSGHGQQIMTLPLGAVCKMDTTSATIAFEV